MINHDSLGALPMPTIHDEVMAAYQYGRHSLSPDRVHPYRLVCSQTDGDCYAAELTRCTDETDLIEGELTGSYVVGNTVLGAVFERTDQ